MRLSYPTRPTYADAERVLAGWIVRHDTPKLRAVLRLLGVRFVEGK